MDHDFFMQSFVWTIALMMLCSASILGINKLKAAQIYISFVWSIVVLVLCNASMLGINKLEAAEYKHHEVHTTTNESRHYKYTTSSFMHLPAGFHRSFPVACELDPYGFYSFLRGDKFCRVLSSPSFNSSSPHSNHIGFSLAFYVDSTNDSTYLAVCAGGIPKSPDTNGYAFPVWIANLHHPIRNSSNASLVVVHNTVHINPSNNYSTVTTQLQLKDGSQVVWNVSNVGMMEMTDSGDFLIYDSLHSISRGHAPVFRQSPITDTLVEGQRLTVGMQLTSNDSAYSARMEKGGLTLYLNGDYNPHETGAADHLQYPYWAFPVFRDADRNLPNPSIRQLVYSAPSYNCSKMNMSNPPYLHVSSIIDRGAQPVDPLYKWQFKILEPGSCGSTVAGFYYRLSFLISNISNLFPTWSFVRLESDGRLYFYVVGNSSFEYIARYALDSADIQASVLDENGKTISFGSNFFQSSQMVLHVDVECDVPLACGPLGVCTSHAKTSCSCPSPLYFEPRNLTDITQGCKRLTSLPGCTARRRGNNILTNSTSFLELNSTANIFLLINGGTSGMDIDACKHACSLDCSCLGVSYQFSTSSCFLITQEISLLTIFDLTFTYWNYTYPSPYRNGSYQIYVDSKIHADDFVTYLKVAPALLPISAGSPPGQPLTRYVPSPFSMMALVGIVLSSVLVCFLLGLGGYSWRKRRRRLQQQAKEEEGLRDILPLLPARFSYKELQQATKSFSKLLGAGGCGSVYAGTLLDGRKVAVKVLVGAFQGAHSQCKDFLAELATVGRTGHHNIVRLVGFCWQVPHRLLVYEYMERGSLDRWLFGVDDVQLLEWAKRYNVVLGVARGLHYLHEECEQPILHFDIKPQNILLSDEFVAKLADFGMSRLMQRDASSVMTGVRGTPGYIAPEWFSQGTVSKKSDIYSMGVVMLEIVAGRKVVDYSLINSSSRPDDVESEAWHLPSWVAKRWKQGWCIQEDHSMRPQAPTVVQWLESADVPIPQPPLISIAPSYNPGLSA